MGPERRNEVIFRPMPPKLGDIVTLKGFGVDDDGEYIVSTYDRCAGVIQLYRLPKNPGGY